MWKDTVTLPNQEMKWLTETIQNVKRVWHILYKHVSTSCGVMLIIFSTVGNCYEVIFFSLSLLWKRKIHTHTLVIKGVIISCENYNIRGFWNFPTLFSHVFVSMWIIGTKCFKIDLVLSKRAAVDSSERGLQHSPCRQWLGLLLQVSDDIVERIPTEIDCF